VFIPSHGPSAEAVTQFPSRSRAPSCVALSNQSIAQLIHPVTASRRRQPAPRAQPGLLSVSDMHIHCAFPQSVPELIFGAQ
jgi:hypothetical protein